MNTAYLDTLPAIADTKGLQLDMGEKLVFTAPLSMFGTETDQFLGGTGSVLYLTNRRIAAHNTVGLFSASIATDVASYETVTKGSFVFKTSYTQVNLNTILAYGTDGATLRGFHFYFKRKGDQRSFEDILANVLPRAR